MKTAIQTEINKVLATYDSEGDRNRDSEFSYTKTNTLFLSLLEKTNQDTDVVLAYLHFVFPLRNQDAEMNKSCIKACENLIKKNQKFDPYDYLKLAKLYEEIEDYENEFICDIEAEKLLEKKGHNHYVDIAWYYDEIAHNYPKAIEYYKKYLEHNRVWFSDNKQKTLDLINRLEVKLKSQNK